MQNLKEKIRIYETKHCFAVSRNNSKHFFRIFVYFQFCETTETRQNSDLFRTVSYFAKLEKNTKLSTLMDMKITPGKNSITYLVKLDMKPLIENTLPLGKPLYLGKPLPGRRKPIPGRKNPYLEGKTNSWKGNP